MTNAPPLVKDALTWFARNPFFVLDLTPNATRRDVERAAQKLAALIAVGGVSGSRYQTPFGLFPRDINVVQTAVTALRDPVERVVHEHFYEIILEQPAFPETSKLEIAIDSALGRFVCRN